MIFMSCPSDFAMIWFAGGVAAGIMACILSLFIVMVIAGRFKR